MCHENLGSRRYDVENAYGRFEVGTLSFINIFVRLLISEIELYLYTAYYYTTPKLKSLTPRASIDGGSQDLIQGCKQKK